MKIIQERYTEETIEYFREFRHADCKVGWSGYSFPCDEQGNMSNQDAAMEHFQKCVSGEYDVVDEGVVPFKDSYTHPRIGQCKCGEEVILDRFTNTCECGIDYNMSGQRLADRSQWGEETGESVSDILMVDADA